MITGIIQARMGSSRLPGKVLRKAAGKTMFEHLLERVRRSKTLEKIVLATTVSAKDDPLADLAGSLGVDVFRGSESDVLDRFLQAATLHSASVVVRLLNDCPLLDPMLVDEIVSYFLASAVDLDFLSNQHPHTYPDGMDVSVFSMQALRQLAEATSLPAHREHIVPGFWEMGLFRWQNYHNRVNLFKEHRWTLDYEEDFQLIHAVFDELYAKKPAFGLNDILTFLASRPDIRALNERLVPRNIEIRYV